MAQTIDPAAVHDDDFGRYRIIRPLGEGGMGSVYLAEQYEPIRRQVALKVIKLGMDTAQVLARFANERQALAIMDHPNIARIFDAGATPKGRPYFVMEYIEGAPVTKYCDGKRMTVTERLQLFLTVCSAVQHAHQKGVIHRDIKPSNVLVKDQDGKPLPKVIDFGIAKATDQWAVENTLLTQFGQMLGTPEYASPEQADVTTGAVYEASDVYSLGVLLYELLIGTVPMDAARMRQAGLYEMLRIIRQEEAAPLPERLDSIGGAATSIAASRRTDAASLRRMVDGGLNWIARKALEKVRERRYASVADLATDIERHLEHRPVLASTVPAKLGPARKTTIVLGEFTNTTGDPAFDGVVRQMLAFELDKSANFGVLPDVLVCETLRLMLRPPDTKLTPDVAAEICERTGSAAAVEGWIARLGRQYVWGMRARDCRTGDVLEEQQASSAEHENVLQTLSQMAERFRIRLGPSLPSVDKQAAMMEVEITTPSLEAWRNYNAGAKAVMRRGQPAESISLIQRAIEIDPEFAMAYAVLGRTYDSLGQSELGAEMIARAYQLRDRACDREKFHIVFNYHRQVPRNLEMARQTLDGWIQKYPHDLMPHGFLSGFASPGTGRHQRAAEEGQKAIEFDPDFSIGYYNAAFAYLYQNRAAEAEALLRKASEQKIEAVPFSLCRYYVAFLRNDKAAMEAETAGRKTKLDAHGWFEHQEAMTCAYHGRLEEANRLSEHAVRLARQVSLAERAAVLLGARAVWNALYGVRAEAEKSASAALALFRGRDADYGPAFALALLRESVDTIVADLEQRYPEDTPVQFSYLPVLRALGALNQGDPAKAVEMTQTAALYELAVPGTAYVSGGAFFGSLYPVYVRGLAYARMGRHREAAAEFQKILDHPGIVLNDPIGPIARLQLARALSASGDREGSALVYAELAALWKNADPDLPVFQEPRA